VLLYTAPQRQPRPRPSQQQQKTRPASLAPNILRVGRFVIKFWMKNSMTTKSSWTTRRWSPPPPFTLPNFPTTGAAPFVSGQKRGGKRLDKDEADDTGTLGGGAQHPAAADGQEAIYITLHSTTPVAAAPISRKEAMAAFVEAPFFPNASEMRVDHVTALMALLAEDTLRSAAISLICKSYTPENYTSIWAQW
jgi:hypothetical protein